MLFNLSESSSILWLYAERYLMGGTRSYSPYAELNEMDPIWHPDSNIHSFNVSCFWLEVSKNTCFLKNKSNNSNQPLINFYSPDKNRFLLPIHPATISLLPLPVQQRILNLIPGPSLTVSPTSSTRTLYVHNSNGLEKCPHHFLKLHFPGRISRFIRSITPKDVIHQLWISEQLQNENFPHLPDLCGGYTQFEQEHSIGFLIRANYQDSSLTDSFFTIPGYSFYGIDKNSPNDPPLLAQLPYFFKETVKDFVVNRIILPLVNLWIKIVKNLGVIPELHGQNVLFCFSRCCSVSSIHFRDSDLFIDNRIRHKLNKSSCPINIDKLDYESEITTEQILSLSYDGFLVHHFLSMIATCVRDWFGIPVSVFREATVKAFRNAGGDLYLTSKKIYHYDNQLRLNGQFNLIEQTSFDLWR